MERVEHTTLPERQAIVRQLREILQAANSQTPSAVDIQSTATYFQRRPSLISRVWSARYDLAAAPLGPAPRYPVPQLVATLTALPPNVLRAPLRTVARRIRICYTTLQRRLQELENARAELFVETWFSTDQGSLERLLEHINSATATFDISMYILSHPTIGAAILRKFHAGVRVRIMTDRTTARAHPETLLEFIYSGIPVYVRRSTSLMHEKFAVIDGRLVLGGSSDWSKSAFLGRSGNFENLQAIRDVFTARAYIVHFDMVIFDGLRLDEDDLL